MKKYSGKIVYVRKNYGQLLTTIDGHNVRLYFFVKPNMVSDNFFVLGKYVKFEVRNMTIRYTNVVCAYNLISANKNPKPVKLESEKEFLDIGLRGYYDLSDDPKNISKETKEELITQNNAVNAFLLNWILFLEKETKRIIEKTIDMAGISHNDYLDKLIENKQTAKIIKDAFKTLKDDIIFREESDSFKFKEKENDPNDVDIVYAPLSLIFEQLTITELACIFKVTYNLCKEKLDKDFETLNHYLSTMLLDVAFIRNKAAHGNAVIPLILDDAFSPSYFYEMASIYPQWNSNNKTNDVENYSAFEFIRFNARMMAKDGVNLAGIYGGPLQIALFYTKSLLINQAKKSLFSLVFLLMCIFSYWDKEKYDDFRYEIEYLSILFSNEEESNIFLTFPSKENSISIQLTRILIPIFYYSDTPAAFKMYSSICYEVSRNAK